MKDTLPSPGLCPEPPAELLRKSAADRQAQPQPLALGGIERLENSFHRARADARTRIDHRYTYHTIARERTDLYPALRLAAGANGFDAISNQDDQHMFEPACIASDCRQR